MQSRLPEDHYRYIVCHVQDRKDLLSLRLTSHALGYEAEKIIYQTVVLYALDKFLYPRLSYLSKNRRTASYVESFFISAAPAIPFWRDSRNAKLLRGFLRKAHNLKELCIIAAGGPGPFMTLGELAEGAKFSLRNLRCNLPAGASCSRFLQSQTGIVDLCWLSDSVPTVTQSHLPNLTSLETRKTDELLMALLPGSKVVRLKHQGELRGTFNTIEVLHWTMFTMLEYIPQHFPNLRYLSASFLKVSDMLNTIQALSKLQKLVTSGVDPEDTKSVAELFSTNPALRYIAIYDDGYSFEFERGADNTPGQILSSMRCQDSHEWKSWW